MRKIHKTISLEPMTSRLPSVVPAYNPIDNSIMYFDDNALKARGYTYTSNYGLVPCCVYINGRQISFERLSIWYYKFKEYYNLLKCGHCGVLYNTAVEYYDNEVRKYPDDLKFGNIKQTYIDLDQEISDMGGRTTYDYICEYLIPTYTIPSEYQHYWAKETLYYPDVIRWIGWFKSMFQYSACTSETDCRGTSGNCCNCAEYVNRGGNIIYSSMESWYIGIQNKIPRTNDCETSIILPIHLENSIEDLGEFSIFCEEYKIGIDYRAANGYSDTANTKVGTLVIKDDEIKKLVSGPGYTFDEVYMENIEDKDAWTSVTLSNESANVTGYTSSKLRTLHLDNYLTDDIGNMIEGLYDVSGKENHQPKEGETLELLYQVGVVTNVTNIEGHDGIFKGDVIDSMSFYYMTYDGVRTSSKQAQKGKAKEALEGVSKPSDMVGYYDDIFCDVTYHIGNIYELNEDGDAELKDLGVSYTEQVQFEKANVEYYLKNKVIKSSPSDVAEPKVHSVSYPICVYRLKQKNVEIRDNTYNTPYEDNLTKFEITADRKYDRYHDTSGDTKSPLMREEYRLGVAAPESVKGDIYIDRGINSAFEKHLKLGEVATFEALENFGNGYFKIMDK